MLLFLSEIRLFSSFNCRKISYSDKTFFQKPILMICETVYGRVIDVATSAHGIRSGSYYVELHFLGALNRKIL